MSKFAIRLLTPVIYATPLPVISMITPAQAETSSSKQSDHFQIRGSDCVSRCAGDYDLDQRRPFDRQTPVPIDRHAAAGSLGAAELPNPDGRFSRVYLLLDRL
jgi:hypothetical protein